VRADQPSPRRRAHDERADQPRSHARVAAHGDRPARRQGKPAQLPAKQPRAGQAPRTTKPKAITLRPAPSRVAPSPAAYIAVADAEPCRFIAPMSTDFFDTASAVRAEVVESTEVARSAAATRNYDEDDLMAIAEVGYHYLFSGGVKLALALFDGLTAVAPREPYFALALGLTYDHMNETDDAQRWYRRAGELDRGDGRPDVNRAELCVEAGDMKTARRLLDRGAKKAMKRGDQELARKATALLAHLSRNRRLQGRAS